jgi:predicted nucleotidyltransferase
LVEGDQAGARLPCTGNKAIIMAISRRTGTVSELSRKQTKGRELEEIMAILRQYLPELREQYKLKSLGVFGSYVHAEQRKRSDLDVLVEFEEAPTLLELSALQRRLTDLVGVKVDLVLRRTLKPAIGEVILSEAVYI